MRHRKHRRRLSEKPAHAQLLLRNLMTSLILYERITTQRSYARAVQPLIDRLFHTARSSRPHVAVRHLNSVLLDRQASRKVMEVMLPRFRDRRSGLTRITPLGYRQGDGADVVEFSFIDTLPS